MADIQHLLREQAAADREAKQAAAKAAEEANKFPLIEEFGKYDRLLQNEDFRWWLGEKFDVAITREHDKALECSLDSSDRNNHAQRHEALKTLRDSIEGDWTRLGSKLERS